jgi:hypothetical protein
MPRLRALVSVRNRTLAMAMAASLACDRGGDEEAPPPEKQQEPVAETPEKPAEEEKADPPQAAAKEAPAPVAKAEELAPKPAAAGKELLAYVPESAKLVLVADPKAVGRSSLFAQSSDFVDKLHNSRIGAVGAAAKACGVGIDMWSSLLVAGAGDSELSLIGARATGIGKKETVQCLADRVNALGEPGKWTVSEEDGRVTFQVEGREDRGIAAADDVLLMVGKDYVDEVNAILAGTGKSAADGSLGKLVRGVDRSKHVYFAGHAPPDMAQGPFTNMQHLSGTIDFSSGLALAISVEYSDAATAETSAQTFGQLFEMTRDRATAIGIPAAVMSTVKIETKGAAVFARASASKADLEAIATAFQKQL